MMVLGFRTIFETWEGKGRCLSPQFFASLKLPIRGKRSFGSSHILSIMCCKDRCSPSHHYSCRFPMLASFAGCPLGSQKLVLYQSRGISTPKVWMTKLTKSSGAMTSKGLEKGPFPDLSRNMQQPRAQTSVVGPASSPTATSGAKKSMGVPSIFRGGEELRKHWSKSMSLASGFMMLMEKIESPLTLLHSVGLQGRSLLQTQSQALQLPASRTGGICRLRHSNPGQK